MATLSITWSHLALACARAASALAASALLNPANAAPLLSSVAAKPSAPSALPPGPRSVAQQRYVPAVLRLSFTVDKPAGANTTTVNNASTASNDDQTGFIDITLIPPTGEVVGRRVNLNTKRFSAALRQLYLQLSKQESLAVDNPDSPARQLYAILIDPVRPALTAAGVSTLLISADPGLQAIPFAALHDGNTFFGESFAFSLTPSLGLMPLDPPNTNTTHQQVAAGASKFDGLNPLPLVPQELSQVVAALKQQQPATIYLNETFTPQSLLATAADNSVERIHLATHAEFLPGGPSKARLFTGTAPLSLKDFSALRQRREGAPLQLFVLSACRTALGDRDSELGFAGLALQAGSRSAIGSLWYVDDVATSAFFVQFYRYLDSGIPKAEAMQRVRTMMAQGQFRLEADRILGPDTQPLLSNLNKEQQRRIAAGMNHPYFWAGIALLGTPW